MTQKRRKADSGKAIRETTALRWEPTHVTKPNPRVVLLQPCPDVRPYMLALTILDSHPMFLEIDL